MPDSTGKEFFNLDKFSDEDIRDGFHHQLGLMLIIHTQIHGNTVTSLGSAVVDLLGAETAMRMFGELVKRSNVGKREGTMPKDKPFEISQAAIDEVRAVEDYRREQHNNREKRENLIIEVARQFKVDKLKINPGGPAIDDEPNYQEKLHAEYVIDVVLSKIK